MRKPGTTSGRLAAGLLLVGLGQFGLGFLGVADPASAQVTAQLPARAAVQAAPEGAALAVTATSPPYAKVGVVPDAVSVTFSGPIRSAGSDVIVTGPGVVSFETRTEVVGDTLREYLKPGPAGAYVVAWQALGENGENLEGSFSFTAQKAHADYTAPGSGVPASPDPPSPSQSPSPSPDAASSPPAGVVPPAAPPGGDHGGGGFDLPRLAVPVGVAVLLVGASGLIAVANRRRPQRPA